MVRGDLPPISCKPSHGDMLAEPRLQLELPGVGIEIVDELLTRRIGRVLAWKRTVRERRPALVGMQVEPIIMAMPGRTYALTPLEEDKRYARLPQAGRDGQPGRSCTDNNDLGQSTRMRRCRWSLLHHPRGLGVSAEIKTSKGSMTLTQDPC